MGNDQVPEFHIGVLIYLEFVADIALLSLLITKNSVSLKMVNATRTKNYCEMY